MDVINEPKLQAVGDEVVDRAAKQGKAFLDALDGWTITFDIPVISVMGYQLKIPSATFTLNKPKEKT